MIYGRGEHVLFDFLPLIPVCASVQGDLIGHAVTPVSRKDCTLQAEEGLWTADEGALHLGLVVLVCSVFKMKTEKPFFFDRFLFLFLLFVGTKSTAKHVIT